MPKIVTEAGFEPGPITSYGQSETTNEGGTTGWVDMGANAMAANGRISQDMAAAYSADANNGSRPEPGSATSPSPA